jgi:SAM-dependent methyltransferase
MTIARYAIEGGERGKKRLDVLSAVMDPLTTSLLDRAGIDAAHRCVDIGCGGGHVTRELARRACDGHAVGIDIDPEVVELARLDAQQEGIENLVFRVGDATALDDGPYDLAYARFLLSHVDDPAGAVSAMVAALRPGGIVLVEDIDFSGSFCHPDSSAYRRYVELYRTTVARRGGNADIGPALPALLRAAGLNGIGLSVGQPAGLDGEAKLISPLTLERISRSIVEEDVAPAEEVEEVLAELYAFHEDPTTVMSLPRIVQAWGRA